MLFGCENNVSVLVAQRLEGGPVENRFEFVSRGSQCLWSFLGHSDLLLL